MLWEQNFSFGDYTFPFAFGKKTVYDYETTIQEKTTEEAASQAEAQLRIAAAESLAEGEELLDFSYTIREDIDGVWVEAKLVCLRRIDDSQHKNGSE